MSEPSGRRRTESSKVAGSKSPGSKSPGPRSSKSTTTTTSSNQSAAEARAEYEANRLATREARERKLAEAFPEGDPGPWVGRIAIAVTALFGIATLVGVVDPDEFIVAYFAVTVSLFVIGCVLFMWVLVAMALRSRDDLLSIAGVFFLSESAPRSTRLTLLGAFAAQVIIGVLGAAVRPFTPLAVGTLVPLFGLAMVGLWAVRHGYFAPQNPESGTIETTRRQGSAKP